MTVDRAEPNSREITLLGDVAIRDSRPDARSCRPVGSPQVCVALAMLTLERSHGVTRDALAEAIWPNELHPTWGSALRTLVSRVRAYLAQALGEDDENLVVARGGRYLLRLPDDLAVDVEVTESHVEAAQASLAQHQFDRARRLAELASTRLRTPFLPDHDGDWVASRRARLTDSLVVALEVTSRATSALGDARAARLAALEAVRRAPLRESTHRCLMAAHEGAGNRAEALRAYQRLRRTLADELGADPDSETEAAYLRLLGPPPSPTDSDHEDPSSGTPEKPISFVGRDVERAAATLAWSRAKTGSARLLLVTGEAGIGKTRLVTEVAGDVTKDGGLVLFGRCTEGAGISYQPFVEMLDALVAATPDDELPALSPQASAELANVFPAFVARGESPRHVNRPLLFDAVAKLVMNTALDHPLLVVLDDAQWADNESTLLLSHLLRHTQGVRLLVVVVRRDHLAPSHLLSDVIRTFDDNDQLIRLELDGLDPVAGRALAEGLSAGSPHPTPVASKLLADTAGNPYLLVAVARAHASGASTSTPMSDPIWARLQGLVANRLGALAATTRRLLEIAAVSGRYCELDIAAAAGGFGETVAIEAFEAALASGLVVQVAANGMRSRFRFRHEIIRHTLYAQLSDARRSCVHQLMADAVERLRQDTTASRAVTLAHHRCAAADAGGDVCAVRWALLAGGDAQARGVPSDGLHWCRRALDHVPPGDVALEAEVLTQIGRAQAQTGDPDAAETLFGGAMRARRAGRTDLTAQAAVALADLARHRPQHRRDAAALIDDLLVCGRPKPEEWAVSTDWARLVARRLELDGSTGLSTTWLATATSILTRHLRALCGPDDLDDRLRWSEDLRVVAEATGDRRSSAVAHHHRAMGAAMAGDQEGAEDAVTSMANDLRSADDSAAGVLLTERQMALAVVRGDFGELRHARVAPRAAQELGGSAAGVMIGRQLVVAAWMRGRLDEVSVDDPADGQLAPAVVAAERALVALVAGDARRAHFAMSDLVVEARESSPGDEWLHTLGLLGLGAVELSDSLLARDLYELLAPYERLTCGAGYRSFAGTAAFHLGRLAMVAGEWSRAERHLTDALQQLTDLRARPWAALAQHALARVLDRRGGSSDRLWITALATEASWLARRLALKPLDGESPGHRPAAEDDRSVRVGSF
jgi:DNA-binding SARP family transcriptional activator